MPAERLEIGAFEIIRLMDVTFRVDGGAMFGGVPKTLWDKRAAPDSEDRITLALNCYLVRSAEAAILVDGNARLREGVEAVLIPGHTAFHQGLKITSGGRTFFYLGDAVPTSAHVDLAYIMSYDLYPVETHDNKKRLYAQAVAEEWVVAFSHELRRAFGTIRAAGRKHEFEPLTGPTPGAGIGRSAGRLREQAGRRCPLFSDTD